MLIWIDGTRENFAAINHQTVDALVELGEAGYKGRHAIACNRTLANYFATLGTLSDRSRTYFQRLYNDYTQLGNFFSTMSRVRASLTVAGPILIGGEWHVPIALFREEVYLEELCVVCENDTDYDIYHSLAALWLRQMYPECVLASRSRAGGGAACAGVIARLVQPSNPIYLCLLDSDRDVVLGAEGATARGVRNVWMDSWRSHLFVTVCRELENALPLAGIRYFIEDTSREVANADHMHLIAEDLRDYACLKSGELPCRFHDVPTGHQGRVRTVRAIVATADRVPTFRTCSNQCESCDCNLFPRFGENFLAAFSQWLREPRAWRRFPRIEDWTNDAVAAARIFASMALALPRRQ